MTKSTTKKGHAKTKTETAQVDKNWTVGDIVSKFPSSAEIMLGHGLHCVGCGVAYWETLEQGGKGHGMSDEEIGQIVDEINAAAKNMKTSSDGESLTVTGKAIAKIKDFQEKNGHAKGLRIGVVTGGCSGMTYRLSFEDKPVEGDREVEIDGVKFFIEGRNYNMLKGITIDFLESLQGAGFKINNPNATKSCGCGESFG